LAFTVMASAMILFGLSAAAIGAQGGGLPAVQQLATSYLDQDVLIYDRHGTLIADIGRSGDHRIVVPLTAISRYVIEATIAIEDRSFYSNAGVDPLGVLRAAVADVIHGSVRQGGSTITQQLAKVALMSSPPDNRVQRKFKEMILAIQLNHSYSKDQILEWYLNSVYYGNQAYGIEAAARSYFHTSAKELTLPQAALLAGLPQAPTTYNPSIDPAAARRRQAEVLAAMRERRTITAALSAGAAATPLTVYPAVTRYEAPAFVGYVLDWLGGHLHRSPSSARGYRITTSLDLASQHRAEDIIRKQIAQRGGYYNFHDASLVAMDPRSGEILAMVGGNDRTGSGGQINMATSLRQPGSSFKIYTYTAAIESRRVNMVSPVLDAPLIFPVFGGSDGYAPYTPSNYDDRFHGVVPLKMAMGNSLNIPALKVEMRVGIPAVLDAARRMGVQSMNQADDSYSLSLTLGTYGVSAVDMVTGASTLANLGVRHLPAPVLTVKDGIGRELYRYDPKENEFRAVEPEVAFIIDSIMSDDRNRCLEFGCHGDLTLPGRHVAAKTGTTQVFRDNWTVGFTPSLATAVWVGNPDNQPLSHNSTGIVGAAPIWNQFMAASLAEVPDEWYQPPADLQQVGDDYFLPGTQALPLTLAAPWPVCRFGAYSPYALRYSDILVDNVPCTLIGSAPQPPVWRR
jgi:membrane peptidoglycan carboxypeptidase